MKRFFLFLLALISLFLVISCEEVDLPGGGEDDGDINVKWSGVRVSTYGMNSSFGEFPGVSKMCGFAKKMSDNYEGSKGTYILIVGTMSGEDSCQLRFPVSGEYDYIRGSKNDFYEEYLNAFDKYGYSVWLQVEPGYADLETLVKLVMDQYGHHSCVKGFGIDVEWHKPVANSDRGTRLTDAQARKVLAAVRKYNSEYTLFVKHWMKSYLPSKMEGLIYINDSQQFDSLEDYVETFSDWAKNYAPYPVMFQIGYNADRWIWSKLKDPAKDLGNEILKGCKYGNDVGIIWVDFTLDEVL